MRGWKIVILLPLAGWVQEAVPVPKADSGRPTEEITRPAPPQRCATPLLNVLKPPLAWEARPDPMVIVPRPERLGRNEIQPPAPSCADVKTPLPAGRARRSASR